MRWGYFIKFIYYIIYNDWLYLKQNENITVYDNIELKRKISFGEKCGMEVNDYETEILQEMYGVYVGCNDDYGVFYVCICRKPGARKRDGSR